jgi:dolichol kinase
LNEVKRKAIHLSALAIPIGVWLVSSSTAFGVLGLIGSIWITGDALRLIIPSWNEKLSRIFNPVIRQKEKKKSLTGSSYLLLSSFLSVAFYPKPIAVLALTFLILGDTAAALVGSRWGRISLFPGKSLEGSLACLGACLAIGLALDLVPFWKVLIGAVVAAAAEALPFGPDDNLTMPLTSGAVMTLL